MPPSSIELLTYPVTTEKSSIEFGDTENIEVIKADIKPTFTVKVKHMVESSKRFSNFLPAVVDTIHFFRECFLTMYKKPSNGFKAIFTHPLLFSIVFMVSGGLLNGLMIPLAQEFQRQWQRQHANIVLHQFVLDDVLFGIFPFVDLVAFADKYLGFFVVMSAVRFFMTPGRLVVLRRFTFLMGVNFFLRSVCLYFTLLSDPSQNISDVDGNPLLETF
ncbi:hypothetical protein EIN_094420, partial [Entamoeba invadens IP1]